MARWREAVDGKAESARVQAIDLYGGGVWGELRGGYQELRETGIEIRIVSAGLGLLSPEDKVPAYDATFAPGSKKNAIGGVRGATGRNREWWKLLGNWQGKWIGPRTFESYCAPISRGGSYHRSYLWIIWTRSLRTYTRIIKNEADWKRTVVLAAPYSSAGRRIPRGGRSRRAICTALWVGHAGPCWPGRAYFWPKN